MEQLKAEEANRRGVDVNIRSGPQVREYEAIADRLAAENAGPILDWGCGLGAISDLLRKRGVEVESFDYRADLAPGKIRLEQFPEIEVHVSNDPVRLPFADGQFATVLSCGVLEHVEQPEASLRELHRVLRPGGRLFVYKLPNRFSYLEAIARRAGLFYHGKLEHDRLYDRRRTHAILEDNGFRVDRFRRTNMLPLTVPHPLAWRFARAIWDLNRAIAKVPLLNVLSTNVEADATAVPFSR